MHQLKDIQGSGQLLQLLKHFHIHSPFQKMWLIALHWAQLQSRFHIPLLHDPKVPAPHLESLYITSLREFLSSINGSIVTEHSYTIPLHTIAKDVVDCAALGAITERVSHPTPSRS
jgi:hypothetical protein